MLSRKLRFLIFSMIAGMADTGMLAVVAFLLAFYDDKDKAAEGIMIGRAAVRFHPYVPEGQLVQDKKGLVLTEAKAFFWVFHNRILLLYDFYINIYIIAMVYVSGPSEGRVYKEEPRHTYRSGICNTKLHRIRPGAPVRTARGLPYIEKSQVPFRYPGTGYHADISGFLLSFLSGR